MYSFHSVDVERITNDGLTKHIYHFVCTNRRLEYESYSCYNRSTDTDVWPNEWPKAVGLDEWLKLNKMEDWEESYEGEEPNKYVKYYDSLNPCMCKTTDGRIMGFGCSGYLFKKMAPLPEGVGKEAKIKFCEILEVEE